MGKIDTITKEYVGNPVVFADAFNQLLYHGNQKIDPARLTELDTTEIVIPYGASGATVAILITEFVVLILRLWIVRDDYNFKDAFCDVPKYFLIGIITLIAGMLMPNLITSSFLNMAVKSILMLVIYAAIMFMMKLDFNQDMIEFVTRFSRKIKRQK